MPLGSGNIIQTNSGNNGSAAAAPITVSLSSATTGHTVIIGFASDEIATTPAGFVQDAYVNEASQNHYVWRKQTSTGETSWSVTVATNAVAAWWAEEVSGLASAPFVAGITNGTTSNTATISTGTTPTVTATDLLCYASYSAYAPSSSTVVTFSGETNSFTEIHDTAGTDSGPATISIAEGRRFPGAPGTFESTATLSTSKPASAVLVVYEAPSAPVSVIDDVSVDGTFGLTGKVTSRSSGNTFLDLYTGNASIVQGSIELHSDLSVTGTMNYGTNVISVNVVTQTFTVGDVVQSDSTGECMVVRDAWVDATGPQWSNTTNRANTYTTSGWTKVGTATIS